MRKLYLKSLQILALLASLGSMSNLATADEVLSGEQIKKLFPGSHSLEVFGFSVRIVATNGGAVSVSLDEETDRGRWTVKGEQLCISLEKLTENKTGCSQVQYDDKTRLRVQGVTFSVK